MTTPAVRCSGVSKWYDRAAEPALADLHLEVDAGTTLALLGPSGGGKTTALRIVAGFEAPDNGVVEIAGRTVAGPGRFVAPERRRVGMVFQEYALFPHLSVAANVGFGIADRAQRAERVADALALVGMAHLAQRMPHQLSGGQQQRAALARALCPQPSVLLMDEPFSNLDDALRTQVRREVRDILRVTQATALFVTHDQDEALFMGDQVAVLNAGRLEQVATPEEIYRNPASRFVAEFMGAADFLPVRYAEGHIETAAGRVPWHGPPPPDGAVALLRPQDLDMTPGEDGRGVVVDRVFQGPTYLYTVALDSGVAVRVTLPHTRSYDPGTRVQVRIVADEPLRCYLDGRRVGGPG